MKDLVKLLQAQFDKMCATGKLFVVEVTGEELWDKYLGAFSQENDPIFRDPESSSHNCNYCNNFVRRYSNVVAINENYQLMTIFDVNTTDEYQDSVNAVAEAVKQSKIVDVFFETFNELNLLPYESRLKKSQPIFRLGIELNNKRYTEAEAKLYPGTVKKNEVRTFHHMHLHLPNAFVDSTGSSLPSIKSNYKSAFDVFKRGMEEIPLDTLVLVRDLVNQGSLLDGATHLAKLEHYMVYKQAYDLIEPENRHNWCWVNSYRMPFARFRNELMGVLCTELAEGKELNAACAAWNKRVDPINYMKATAPITEKQKKEDEKFIIENGYLESFDRKVAELKDIKVDEILHMNVGDGIAKAGSIFDGIETKTSSRHKRNQFDDVETVHIDKFMKHILSGCNSVEVFFENRMQNNLVAMTTAKDTNCKPLFKWDNPYSWTYKGNLAGKSMIAQAVKNQGGKIDGVLRFSIMWSEGNSQDNSDLDAHCIEPNRTRISYQNTVSSSTGGNLDIDIQNPLSHKRGKKKEVVENITYPSLERMTNGVYEMVVHQFAWAQSEGFKAEVAFDGEIYSYSYNRPVSQKEYITVAKVTLRNGEFSIEHVLPLADESVSSNEYYGLTTNEFHKVSLVCLSPNHWGTNKTGNKHFFFMLEGCKPDTSIRSFHVENLNSDLLKARKTLERLGAITMVEAGAKALAGVGFNATVQDEVILRLKGTFKRMIKVIF